MRRRAPTLAPGGRRPCGGGDARQGRKGEFRSNLHRGGKAEAVKLPAATRRMAVAAARVLGLQMAGVDLWRATKVRW